MSDHERLAVPGTRDVRATLDRPADAGSAADAAVVACPPHPQMGGTRTDARLEAVSDALVAAGVACLRFDYGPWDEGVGEQRDARDALAWASERYRTVGLFGYSFGGGVALCVAADESTAGSAPAAVSALAPAGTIGERSVAEAVDAVDAPLQVVYGERDDTADWEPVVERARERGTVESIQGDHFFVGQHAALGETVADFLVATLAARGP